MVYQFEIIKYHINHYKCSCYKERNTYYVFWCQHMGSIYVKITVDVLVCMHREIFREVFDQLSPDYLVCYCLFTNIWRIISDFYMYFLIYDIRYFEWMPQFSVMFHCSTPLLHYVLFFSMDNLPLLLCFLHRRFHVSNKSSQAKAKQKKPISFDVLRLI